MTIKSIDFINFKNSEFCIKLVLLIQMCSNMIDILRNHFHNANFAYICVLFHLWETLGEDRQLYPAEYTKYAHTQAYTSTSYLTACVMSHTYPHQLLPFSHSISETPCHNLTIIQATALPTLPLSQANFRSFFKVKRDIHCSTNVFLNHFAGANCFHYIPNFFYLLCHWQNFWVLFPCLNFSHKPRGFYCAIFHCMVVFKSVYVCCIIAEQL